MAKEKTPKTVLERTYTIPLRKEWLKAPKYRRAKKAVIATRAFLTRHLKSEIIRFDVTLNNYLWSRGIKNPPHKIKIIAEKNDTGVVTARLFQEPKKHESLMIKRSQSVLGKKEKAAKKKAEEEKKKAEEAKRKLAETTPETPKKQPTKAKQTDTADSVRAQGA